MKLINTDGKEYTPEELLNPGYVKVGSKTYCEYWKKGDTIETFNTVETPNVSVDLLLSYYMYKIDEIFTNSNYTNSDVCYMLSDLKNELSTVDELSVVPESVKWLNKYIDNLIRDLS